MKANTSAETTSKHVIFKLWNRLIEPTATNLTHEQYLKTRLLSSLLIVLALVDFFLSPLIILQFYPDTKIWENPLVILYIGSLATFLTSYVLNRNGRYLPAAVIAIIFTWFVPVAGVLAFPNTTLLYLGIIYLIGVVLFGRILFDNKQSSIITIICAFSILLLPIFNPVYTLSTIQLPFIGFLNIVVLLLILTRHNAQIENKQRDELLQANTLLKISEARWRSLVDNASTGVYLIDDNYRFVYTNSKFGQIIGYTNDELEGLDFRNILAEESKQRVANYYVNRQQGEDVPSRYECKLLRKDHEIRWAEISASVMHDTDGTPLTIGQVLDIHDRKQAEADIRANEEKLQALLQHSSDIVSILDKQGNFLYNSPAGERILGFTTAEIADVNTFDLMHPDDRDYVVEGFSKLLTQPEQIQTVDYRYATKEGGYIWMETAASNQLQHPAIRGIVANSRDISERKRAEKELKQYRDNLENLVTERTAKLQAGESLLRRILDSISDGILVLDAEFRYTFWNRAMEKLSKVSHKQLIGKQPWVQFPHLVAQGVDKIMQQAMTGKSVHREDIPFYLPDGTSGFTAETYLPLYDENGRIHGVVGVVHDITERKQKEDTLRATNERLKEMDALRSKFIADISHELRTPITNLNLYLDLLARGNPHKRSQYESVIRQQSERLIGILEGILDFSNLSSQYQPKMTPLDFNGIVAKSVAIYETYAQSKGVIFTFTPDKTLPMIAGIEDQLTIMINNLLANAVNYTMVGDIIVITKLIEEKYLICLQVTDTGIGLNETELQNCFESFYRGSRVAQLNTTPGAGMGLALVKEIVARHQGRVEVMSQVEQGATFTIYLPLNR